MPYPMTRLCVRVGGKEFNSHSFAPCRRVVDMAEASSSAVQDPLTESDASLRQGDAYRRQAGLKRCEGTGLGFWLDGLSKMDDDSMIAGRRGM